MYLSQTVPSGRPEFRFQCPYIFFDRNPPRKWREDIYYFDDQAQHEADARANGFRIA